MQSNDRHASRSRLIRSLPAWLLLALGLTAAPDVFGQTVRAQVWEPSVALARLGSGESDQVWAAVAVIGGAFQENYARYSDAERRELLDGVERIARGEVQADDLGTRRAVTGAFTVLSIVGEDTIGVPEDREIVRRLLRIYRESDRLESKYMVVMSLGRMLPNFPAEKSEIGALLFSVASAAYAPDRVHPETAIDALVSAGEAGIPVLRRLYEESAVKDPRTATFLRGLAERGYRRALR